uniref:DNA polymerase epsilon catalytic subunit n=2 Tax=Xenopsylla cheopis TaxID=163159 RepID=A0A6M2DZX4_XENCH
MKKIFLQLIAEFQRLGADVVFADFNKVIICTGKRCITDAIGYVDFVVQSIRNKEIFHSIELSYQHCWDFLLWMDAANFSGVRGNLPSGFAESTVLGTEDEQDLDMNWNISEGLPDDLDCKEHFETLMLKYMEALATINKEHHEVSITSVNVTEMALNISKAIKSLSYVAFAAVQKMHKLRLKKDNITSNPALEYIKAVHKVLSIDNRAEEEIESLNHNMLRLIGVGDFSDRAVWKNNCDSFVLKEVICKACYHCRDLDLCRDKHRAMKDDSPVWLCSNCLGSYPTEIIELKLIDIFQRKIMSYSLQDLICIKCKEIRRENLAKFCSCAGEFQNLISRNELHNCIRILKQIAVGYNMELLLETVDKIII